MKIQKTWEILVAEDAHCDRYSIWPWYVTFVTCHSSLFHCTLFNAVANNHFSQLTHVERFILGCTYNWHTGSGTGSPETYIITFYVCAMQFISYTVKGIVYFFTFFLKKLTISYPHNTAEWPWGSCWPWTFRKSTSPLLWYATHCTPYPIFNISICVERKTL